MRTFVWRRMNRLQALYLQQAVCLLPDTESNAGELESLALRVREFEGEATLLQTASKSETWESEILARFESGRASKYEKLQEEIQKFIDEVEFEEHRKRFTPEEVEELEEKFEGLGRWFEKLRHGGSASPRTIARTKVALETAERRLEDFAGKVENLKKLESSSSNRMGDRKVRRKK